MIRGLVDAGVDVVDIGLCGTEGVYFATFALGLDGGIMVTASHNPPDYNGMKFVREGSRPISRRHGPQGHSPARRGGQLRRRTRARHRTQVDTGPKYIEHLLSYVDRKTLKPLKIVCNAGNGGAG